MSMPSCVGSVVMTTSKSKLIAALTVAIILLAACNNQSQTTQPEPEALPVQSVLELEVEQPAEEEPDVPEEEPIVIYRGIIEEDVYLNSSIGLSFALPEGWSFADDETIAMMMGVGIELIAENGGFDLDTSNIDALYDMVAYNATTDSNTMVMIETLDVPPGTEPPTAQGQLEALRERLEEMDVFGFEFGRPFTVWIAGETFDTLPITVSLGEIQTQQYYLVRIQGGYMVTIIASLFDDITFEELIGYFG